MTAKKCRKKRDARARIVVLLIKPIAFVTFPLPSRVVGLKVPSYVRTDNGFKALGFQRTNRKSAIMHAIHVDWAGVTLPAYPRLWLGLVCKRIP